MLLLGTALRQIGNIGTRSLLFAHMASMGIPTLTISAINAVSFAVQIGAMIVAGRLVDSVGRRPMLLIGFALSAVAIACYAVSRQVSGFLLASLVVGVAFPCLFIGSTAMIGDQTPLAQQGARLGLFEASRGIGGVLGPIVAGLVAPVLGYNGMMWCMAGIATSGFVCALISAFWHRCRPHDASTERC
jgi:MFS family permease